MALPAGSLAAVTGANGSGKSTLLRVVAGVTRPSVGVVRARPVPVGWVPDRFPVPTIMTAANFLVHMGRIRGLAPAVAIRRSGVLLERLGLRPGPDEALGSLSKGNLHKVAIAQALLAPAGLLVLDEPWSGLDAEAACVLGQLIAEARHAGSVVVVSAHHRRGVDDASHLLVLRAGKLEPPQAGERGLAGRLPPDPRGGVEVRLARHACASADVQAVGGVDGVWEGGELVLSVAAEALDALLVRALGSGWSVIAVIPEHPSGEKGTRR